MSTYNNFILANNNFTSAENRVIRLATVSLGNKTADFWGSKHTLNAKAYAKVFNLASQKEAFVELKKAAKRLQSRIIQFDDSIKLHSFVLVPSFWYEDASEEITITFNQHLKQFLIGLNRDASKKTVLSLTIK